MTRDFAAKRAEATANGQPFTFRESSVFAFQARTKWLEKKQIVTVIKGDYTTRNLTLQLVLAHAIIEQGQVGFELQEGSNSGRY
jgi:hypothetical protein